MSVNKPLRFGSGPLLPVLKRFGSAAVVVLLMVVGFWGSHLLSPNETQVEVESDAVTSAAEARTEVTLSPEKVQAAGIDVIEVKCVELQQRKTVAATIEYDSTRHLSIKSPVPCVVERWQVKSGQVVAKGDPLASLSGAEVALARTEISKYEADLRLAELDYQWQEETHQNLTKLLATLESAPSLEALEAEFDGKRLGEHRDHLLTTYTQFMLAQNVANRSQPLSQQGIIAGSTSEARLSQRDVAATAFKTACEQSEFEGRQQLAKSAAQVDLARQRLSVAQEQLRLLLGPLGDTTAATVGSEFRLDAPFDGRIEALHTSVASRLAVGEPILTLADTRRLWISALIHQHDWDALKVASTETLSFTVPAIPNERFEAHLSFVGPEVSAATRALSLIAELDNSDGRLRPGMFAWVDLPFEAAHSGNVVPTAAVQRHESHAFVFVADGENRFRRVDVETGIETPELIEIKSGLSPGERVVDAGAFYLKSELLLEQEEK